MKRILKILKLSRPVAICHAIKALRRVSLSNGADAWEPEHFRCKDCGQKGRREDVCSCMGSDVVRVSCSNGYSDRVLVTAVRLEWMDWPSINAAEIMAVAAAAPAPERREG